MAEEKKEEKEIERKFRNVLINLAAIVIITAWLVVATYYVASEKPLWVAIGITGATVFLGYLGYLINLWQSSHSDSPETHKFQFIRNLIIGAGGIVIVTTWIALVSYLSLGELVLNAVAISGAAIFMIHFVYSSAVFDHRDWANFQEWHPDFRERVIESTFIVIATIWATLGCFVWVNETTAIAVGATGITIWLVHVIYHGWRLFD